MENCDSRVRLSNKTEFKQNFNKLGTYTMERNEELLERITNHLINEEDNPLLVIVDV